MDKNYCHSEARQSRKNPANKKSAGLLRSLSFAHNDAFTLAEVLITLVIIGVIAAITVPSLINKTNNQEYVSRLKKAYSTLAQATNQIIKDEGPVTVWVTDIDNVYDLYKKRLFNAKECGTNTGCFTQGVYKKKDGSQAGDPFDGHEAYRNLVLADGIQINFSSWNVSPECTSNFLGSNNVCAYIFVDVNGARKPNTISKDLFVFSLKANGLYPTGCDDPEYIDTDTWGWGYACKVLREGAINY